VAAKLNEGVAVPATAVGSGLWKRVSLRRLAVELIPFAMAFAVFLAVFLLMRPEPTGDEPHFLFVAQSIAYDGDVDLANDYASRERTLRIATSFPQDTNFQAADYRGTGQLRPLHGVGLSAALAVPTGIWGLTGARLFMVLIAALMADQLYRLLRDLRFRRPWRILAWIATVFCLPVLVFTSQIYSEVPCALLLVVLLRIMVAGAGSPGLLALGSAACAGLVWLHVRYIPLSAGAMLGLAIAAAGPGREEPTRSWLGSLRALAGRVARMLVTRWRTVTVPLAGPYILGVGGLAVAFYHWYGSIDFKAPYAVWGDTTVGDAGWNFVYDIVLTDLFNPVAGWIPFGPVQWIGLAALGCAIVRFGWPAAACVGIVVAYELLGASAGPNAGWQLPARYLLVVIPLIAIPMATALQRVRVARWIFVPLLAISLVFAIAGVWNHEGLYPVGEKPRIFGARTTAPLFPITRDLTLYGLVESFDVQPGYVNPQTGKARDGVVSARGDRDAPGFLLWGPYSSLKEGSYRATFRLAATGAAADDHVAAIEVVGVPPSTFFARKEIRGRELGPMLRDYTLPFETPGGYLTETRVYFLGRGNLTAGPVTVRPTDIAPAPLSGFPDWALAVIWVGGTILAGWLFLRLMDRRPDSIDSGHA
jgi:hypothetical protein